MKEKWKKLYNRELLFYRSSSTIKPKVGDIVIDGGCDIGTIVSVDFYVGMLVEHSGRDYIKSTNGVTSYEQACLEFPNNKDLFEKGSYYTIGEFRVIAKRIKNNKLNRELYNSQDLDGEYIYVEPR